MVPCQVYADVILALTGHHKTMAGQIYPVMATPFPKGPSLSSRITCPSKPQIPIMVGLSNVRPGTGVQNLQISIHQSIDTVEPWTEEASSPTPWDTKELQTIPWCSVANAWPLKSPLRWGEVISWPDISVFLSNRISDSWFKWSDWF